MAQQSSSLQHCPMDSDGFYLGAIHTNNQWRFFYDHRLKWALDLRKEHFQNIPHERIKNLLYTRFDFESFIDSLNIEFSPQEIYFCTGKLPLSVVIFPEAGLFVDGTYADEGFDLSYHIPDEWRIISTNPFYIIPYEIRLLWITKHLFPSIGKIGIPRYTKVGAVKLHGEWRFFFETDEGWKLDYATFIRNNEVDKELTGSTASDFRKQLLYVDEQNGEKFIESLSNTFLSEAEIPWLIYCPNAEHFAVEGLHNLTQPKLQYLINFDDRIFVRNSVSYEQMKLNLAPRIVHAPSHWTCYQDHTLLYLPETLQTLWKVR